MLMEGSQQSERIPPAWPRLRMKAERVADLLASKPWILILTYIVLFLPVTLILSSRIPLNSDELHTVNISRLPGAGAILHALASGADLHPPISFLATRLSQALFGGGEWALRLPATLGVLTMGLCLMHFVARRSTILWGFVAAIFVMLTGAFPFATIARPYGLVLGCAGAALVSWQAATEGGRRKAALAGLSVSLILAVWSHYDAVLLFIPIGMAELVRTIANRKIDKAMVSAILVAVPAPLLVLPLIGGSIHAVAAWLPPQGKVYAVVESYKALSSSQAVLGIFGTLVLLMVWGLAKMPNMESFSFSLAEVTASIGLLALPVFDLLFSLVVPHNIGGRYVICLTIGGALLFVFISHRFTNGSSTASLLLSAGLSAIFFAHLVVQAKAASLDGAEPIFGDARYPDLPIVVGSGLDFATAWHYATPELRSRLIFVTDRQMALRYSGTDLTNSPIASNARLFQWRVEDLAEFRRNHRMFLLSWTEGERWMLPAYMDFGAKVDLLKVAGGAELFLVTDDRATDTQTQGN